MALAKCTNCGVKISQKAEKCPKCGSPCPHDKETHLKLVEEIGKWEAEAKRQKLSLLHLTCEDCGKQIKNTRWHEELKGAFSYECKHCGFRGAARIGDRLVLCKRCKGPMYAEDEEYRSSFLVDVAVTRSPGEEHWSDGSHRHDVTCNWIRWRYPNGYLEAKGKEKERLGMIAWLAGLAIMIGSAAIYFLFFN